MTAAAVHDPDEILSKLKTARARFRSDKETSEQQGRVKLQEFVAQLREPGEPSVSSPASTTQPSFKVGDVPGFPHVATRLPESHGNGNLSPAAAESFWLAMQQAAARPDASSRDAATGRAAKVVARDWAQQHGLLHNKDSVKADVLHAARAQATFAAREIGHKLGIGPVESTIIGYSLERALEREGFKTLVNHSVDGATALFKATASSVATATGMRDMSEQTLNKSMQWLASKGVTTEMLKDVLGKHSGKLSALVQATQHPEALQRAAYILAHSDKALDGVLKLAKDDEFRKAVGTLTMATGESVAGVHKGVGSVAILAGSALRGDSLEDTGRHAFRAALTIAGGALGGLAGGGFLSVATGTAGAMAGGLLADKAIELYDKYTGRTPPTAQLTSDMERQESAKVLGRTAVQGIEHELAGRKHDAGEAARGSFELPAALRDAGNAEKVMERVRQYKPSAGA